METRRSEELYDLMVRIGYPPEFADLVSAQLCTEYTSQRMTAYLKRAGLVPPQEFADEMLAILADRDRLKEKHIAMAAQQNISALYRFGLEETTDETVE